MNIDQIVYCWSPHSLLGTRGVGPIATSLPADALTDWNERLGEAIWAADDAPGGPPGLAYLRFDGGAAVLHKLPVADASGRPGATFTHVLVSPGVELTADLALSLADWDGWYHDEDALSGRRELKRLALAELPRSHPRPTQDAYAAAVPVVSRILASPDQRFSVVAPTAPATGLLRVVLDVIGEIHGPWTFATRESTENGVADARLLFLTRDPEFSAHSGRRIQIRQEDPADGGYADFARTLVDAYQRDGVDVMSRIPQASPRGRHLRMGQSGAAGPGGPRRPLVAADERVYRRHLDGGAGLPGLTAGAAVHRRSAPQERRRGDRRAAVYR